jgi:hypothetical protein
MKGEDCVLLVRGQTLDVGRLAAWPHTPSLNITNTTEPLLQHQRQRLSPHLTICADCVKNTEQ